MCRLELEGRLRAITQTETAPLVGRMTFNKTEWQGAEKHGESLANSHRDLYGDFGTLTSELDIHICV